MSPLPEKPAPRVSYGPCALRAGIPDRCWLLCSAMLVPTHHHCTLHSPSLHSVLGPTSSNNQTCLAGTSMEPLKRTIFMIMKSLVMLCTPRSRHHHPPPQPLHLPKLRRYPHGPATPQPQPLLPAVHPSFTALPHS